MAIKKVKRVVIHRESENQQKQNPDGPKVKKIVAKKPIHDMELFPYKIKGNDLFVWSEKKERYLNVSKAVKINAIKRNIENKNIQIELVFWAYDRWEYITISRGELTKRELKKLASKGLDVLEDFQAAEVCSFLSRQEKTLQPINVHT